MNEYNSRGEPSVEALNEAERKATAGITALAGPKIVLVGPAGSGKTYALGTMVDWAMKHGERPVHALFVESGLETLLGYWRDRGKPVPPNLRYHVIANKPIPLAELIDAAHKVGILSYESVTKMVDPNRGTNNPYEKLLYAMTDFPDDRTGKKFGNIGSWTNEDILCWDSLTETAWAALKMVIGNKPTASQPDYGVAQNNLMNLLRYLTQSFPPTVVLTAHISRQTNEVTGGVKLMVKAIGKALSDDIPPLFSEVIGCVRDGTNWYWDTADSSLDTKTRSLPIASKIKPDFAPIMDKWLERRKEEAPK